IQVSENGLHIYNRDGQYQSTDPFELYSKLNVDDDASHAFYLGVELARAQIAWQLKKRYIQDQALDWGVNSLPEQLISKTAHREAAIKARKGAAKKT
ncbi:MAG: dihydropteroate synthase, partial [Sulfuritalea sp.]|nr:dihydropteroate synthase [Sulfuritalea sp.]